MDPLLIQRAPYGLLDLLGLKGVGQAPINLNPQVTATLADCVDYYLAPLKQVLTGQTIALASSGSFAATGLTVPPGQIWFAYAFAVRLSNLTAAASSITFWGGFAKQNAAGTVIPLTRSITVGAGDNGADAVVFTRPYIFMPGDIMSVATGGLTGAPGVAGVIRLDAAILTL